MKSNRRNDTNYALVEEFMALMGSISPTELTTFYCETCHDRLGTAQDSRPTGPFQENTGTCSHCNRHDDVSNPHFNRFLNERGLPLEYADNFNPEFFDQTTLLIRDWLIPDQYSRYRKEDRYYQEEPQFSWIKYGRKQAKAVYRDHHLSDASKALLLPFYPLFYSAERFAAAPIEEPAPDPLSLDAMISPYRFSPVAIESEPVADTEQVAELEEPLLVGPALTGPRSSPSTFERLRAFVTSMF